MGKNQSGFPYVSADGYNRQYEWTLLPTSNAGSLVGRLGSRGEIFYIGCNNEFVANSKGPLFLSINDSDTRDDNDGSISFAVTVSR